MQVVDGVFRSTYTTPTFVQPFETSYTVPADSLLEVYSPNGRFTLTLGDLSFPPATKVVLGGGLPLAYTGRPTCVGEYDYVKIYGTYEKYSQGFSQSQTQSTAVSVVLDGVMYVASAGTLRKA